MHRLSAALPVAFSLFTTAATAATAVEPPTPHGPIPTARQLAWHDREFYAFVHFNMNTFTGVEWGHGAETPDAFRPAALDTDQWCGLFKECGLSGVILTAKHHDGFCLWDSARTEHDVANSPWRGGEGDVVRELAESCEETGLWLGLYVSPWDRNNPIYGRDDAAYNDYFDAQLRELLGNYGDVAEVWWDGANGDRDDPEKHQEYDWPRFMRTVRELQPEAVVFAPPIVGGDIRWIGNENGRAGRTQWATFDPAVNESRRDLNRGMEGGPVYLPAETDVSIRPGWYWNEQSDDRVKSVEKLLKIYYESVGRNTTLLLNFPVDDRGLVHENDATALRGMAAVLDATFDVDLARDAAATARSFRGGDPRFAPANAVDGDDGSYWATDDGVTAGTLELRWDGPRTFDRVVLREHVELGQRVRVWRLEARVDGAWDEVAAGTTIGNKRIATFAPVAADRLRVVIEDARACPTLEKVGVYASPPSADFQTAEVTFVGETAVTLAADRPGVEIAYTLDGSTPTADSPRYDGPLTLDRSATVAVAAVDDGVVSPLVRRREFRRFGPEDLLAAADLDGETTSPGVNVLKYRAGWQTLDQMAGRRPFRTETAAGFDLSARLGDTHTALAFEGFVEVPRDGMYRFETTSSDGSRLRIGETLVVENDGLHEPVAASGPIGLAAGRHPIRVEWFVAESEPVLEVRWDGPGFGTRPLGPEGLSRIVE